VCTTTTFPGTGTVIGWAGPIIGTFNDGANGPARLHRVVAEAQRLYDFWDAAGAPVAHIGDCEIQPNTVYAIQAIGLGDDITIESNYSPPLTLRTTLKWGDTEAGLTGGASNPGQNVVNIADGLAALLVFGGGTATPRPWVDLEGSPPNTPNYSVIGVADALRALNAFSGTPYPFSGCPGTEASVPNGTGGCSTAQAPSNNPTPCTP
jgi:hypothetical protein